MKALPLTEAKSKLSGLVDRVRKLDDSVVITKNGRPVAVLVSHEEFESWQETLAIYQDKKLMKEIRKGLRELKAGKGRAYTLDELFR